MKRRRRELPTTLRSVVVCWRDAHAVTDAWTSFDDLDQDDALIFTAGFLVPDAKPGHVVIVQSVSPNSDSLDGVIAIPEENVYQVRMVGRSVHLEREAKKWG